MQLVREFPVLPVRAPASDPTDVTGHPVVFTLSSRGALDGWIAGATGSRLARAAAAGLRVPLGFVLTVDALRGSQDPTVRRDVRAAWVMTTASGVRDLVLRLSVVGHSHPDAHVADVVVRDWGEFVDQVRWARLAVRARGFGGAQVALVAHRVAVPAQTGTVRTLPTSGLRNRYVTTLESGATVTMSIGGRLLDHDGPAVRFDRNTRRAVAHLGRDAAEIFGGRPRVDWVIERDGSLVLLDVHPPGEHPPSAYEMRHHLGKESCGLMADKSAAIPRRHVTIVTCMDARVDALGAFDFSPGDAHVLRNAGAVVTDDVLRSLVLSQRLLQTRSVLIMGHTECGLRTFSDDELSKTLAWETGTKPPFDFGAFHDLDAHVRTGVQRVRECPWLPHVDDVRGYVYDVNDHTARPVTP